MRYPVDSELELEPASELELEPASELELEPASELELEPASELELELDSDKVESRSFTPSLDRLKVFFFIWFLFLSAFRATFIFSRSLAR